MMSFVWRFCVLVMYFMNGGDSRKFRCSSYDMIVSLILGCRLGSLFVVCIVVGMRVVILKLIVVNLRIVFGIFGKMRVSVIFIVVMRLLIWVIYCCLKWLVSGFLSRCLMNCVLIRVMKLSGVIVVVVFREFVRYSVV